MWYITHFFVQRAPNTDAKMSSKKFENDGAASRCSSELLSQSDVDNDNGHDVCLSKAHHTSTKSSPSVCGAADSATDAQLQEEADDQLSKPDLIDILSGNTRARSSGMEDRKEGVSNSSSKDDEDPIPFPFSSKVPFKQFTGRMPLASGFNKRFRKCNSATFKLDGMSYLIGRLFYSNIIISQ